MDCDTTGIEPDFSLVKFKKLAGGGYFKIINRAVPEALRTLGYSEAEISDIEAYTVGHASLDRAPWINRNSLKTHGFTDEKLATIERSLKAAFDIKFVFNKWTLGEDFLTDALKVPAERLDDPTFDLLAFLGYSHNAIEQANAYVCGAMMLEGAPHLKDEHLPVFDCANPCGRLGKRYLSVESHIHMMAAAQPFISGAISKTINMPNDATVEDCKASYIASWQLALKANALYRDGSKLSQPLNSQLIADEGDEDALDDFVEQSPAARVRVVAETVADRMVEAANRAHANAAAAEHGVKHTAVIGGYRVSLRTRNDENGMPSQISIDAVSAEGGRNQMVNDVAVAVSLGLQHGVPLETFVSAFTSPSWAQRHLLPARQDGALSTPIIDHVFRQLAVDYLGRHDLQQDVFTASVQSA
jgi:ribonucleoside-diphosphate reductase alpha chain